MRHTRAVQHTGIARPDAFSVVFSGVAQWPNTVLHHRFVSTPEPALIHAYSPTQGPPSRGRQVFSASGKFGGLPRPAPHSSPWGVVTAGVRQPAVARRLLLRGLLGVKAPGSSTRNYCWASPTRGEGPGNGSVLRTIGPAALAAAGLLSAMHGSQPPGWETRYRSLCRLGGFLF